MPTRYKNHTSLSGNTKENKTLFKKFTAWNVNNNKYKFSIDRIKYYRSLRSKGRALRKEDTFAES